MSDGVLQILAPNGQVDAELLPELSEERLLELYRDMVRVRIMDTRMLALQRQGRIGFYGTCKGQEAATVGSGAAVEPHDWVFPALREGAILLMRGYPLDAYVAQLMGCALDPTHGRQMPCHFSSAEHHYVSLSSVIGTQIPQAMGAAWAARIKGDPTVVVGYMGDGATSSTDFHCALTFAAVHAVPCVFFCQNNQFAISVPFSKQTASAGIAVKAKAYGMPGVAVDGNDVLAVYRATRDAVERARSGGGPTLIEAITYRLEGHSSSDDPTRYRDQAVTEQWARRDPIARFRSYLELEGLVEEAEDEAIHAEQKRLIDAAIAKAEAAPPPAVDTLFSDVYAEMPAHIAEQQAGLADEQGGGRDDGAFPL
jgi:pyruvate dehydrogenase E1 component alpha subunit/2-oxoisovalerate dehydrogenase E1 component alpha subunit